MVPLGHAAASIFYQTERQGELACARAYGGGGRAQARLNPKSQLPRIEFPQLPRKNKISRCSVIYPTSFDFYVLLDIVFFQQREVLALSELTTTQQYDSVAAEQLSIIFKHSPTCPISLFAQREVTRFCEQTPGAPVYLISVRRQRDVARHVAQQTGVRHESPQIVVLSRGDVIASASHDAITAEWIASAVNSHCNIG